MRTQAAALRRIGTHPRDPPHPCTPDSARDRRRPVFGDPPPLRSCVRACRQATSHACSGWATPRGGCLKDGRGWCPARACAGRDLTPYYGPGGLNYRIATDTTARCARYPAWTDHPLTRLDAYFAGLTQPGPGL
jgi:hypothetical protein